jgi:hypothetical protein
MTLDELDIWLETVEKIEMNDWYDSVGNYTAETIFKKDNKFFKLICYNGFWSKNRELSKKAGHDVYMPEEVVKVEKIIWVYERVE